MQIDGLKHFTEKILKFFQAHLKNISKMFSLDRDSSDS